MNTTLLLLFAAETILYSLLWHNQPARSHDQDQPRQPDRKVACARQSTSLQEPAEREGMLGLMERQLR